MALPSLGFPRRLTSVRWRQHCVGERRTEHRANAHKKSPPNCSPRDPVPKRSRSSRSGQQFGQCLHERVRPACARFLVRRRIGLPLQVLRGDAPALTITVATVLVPHLLRCTLYFCF